ncbi:MAG: lysophospholipid acyltransferase family protein [Rhodothermia bacterium]|nr:lysophospholipid acyltransferase family protein [Rhodothermia bacterium]
MTAFPALPDSVPRRGRHWLKKLGRNLLSVSGWQIDGNFPDLKKFVVIAAPHTSNWDFVIGLSTAFATDIDAHWIGKHTIFTWPFGGLFKRLGGIAVNRAKTTGLVPQVVQEFRRNEEFVLAIAPEGTRSKVERWKSGFYQIALQAEVPVVCAYFDYPRRTVGIGKVVYPSGDYEADLADITAFYSHFKGRRHRD